MQTSKISPSIKIPGLSIRRFRMQDDPNAIARVIELHNRAHDLRRKVTADDLQVALTYLSNFNWKKDMIVLQAGDDVIGYLLWHWRETTDQERVYRHVAHLVPKWQRRTVGTVLLRFAEVNIESTESNASHHLSPCIDVAAFNSAIGKIALLNRFGYDPYRFFVDMVRNLNDPIPILDLPTGLEIRPVVEEHYRKIWEAADEAFEDHWGHRPGTEEDYRWFLESRYFQPDLWKVAWDGNQVAGMVLNYVDEEENRSFNRLRGYTEDISVRRPWRRRGLARALHAQSLHLMKSLGMVEAALGVDSQNPHDAFGLYTGVGFQKEQRQVVYRKVLNDARAERLMSGEGQVQP